MDLAPDSQTPTSYADAPRRASLRDDVVNYVRHLIFSGHLSGGDRISQDKVASALAVSRLPVREGLILLESYGLVKNVPHRGCFVQELSPTDILDHYDVYGYVSGLAASRCAERVNNQELVRLCEQNLAEFMASSDPEYLGQLNFEFHRAIIRAGASNRVLSLLRVLGPTLPSELFYGNDGDWHHVALDHHQKVLDAIRDGDPAAAAQEMANHLSSGGIHAVELLSDRGIW